MLEVIQDTEKTNERVVYQWWWVVKTVVSLTPCFRTASRTCEEHKLE